MNSNQAAEHAGRDPAAASAEPIEINSSMQWKMIFAANILRRDGRRLLRTKPRRHKPPQTQQMADELDIAQHLPRT